MFEVIIGTVLAFVGAGLIAVAGWLVALSNKVAVLDADRDNLRESLKELFDTKFSEITRRLDRIDRKLDHTEA